jgi:hypothetical protein
MTNLRQSASIRPGGRPESGRRSGVLLQGADVKLLKWVCINLLVLVALLFSIGIVLPRRYYVERSIVINAPAGAILPHVANLREWPEWTAWTTERYPGMEIKFGEKDSGTGAQYSWSIPNQGVGSVVLTGSNPGYGVGYELDIDQGKHPSAGLFSFKPEGTGTKVIWTNEGDLAWSPIDRYYGLMMDRMRGPDLQTGLVKLKNLVETTKQEPPSTESKTGQGQGRGRKGRGRTEKAAPTENAPMEETSTEKVPMEDPPPQVLTIQMVNG